LATETQSHGEEHAFRDLARRGAAERRAERLLCGSVALWPDNIEYVWVIAKRGTKPY
jgi:hypothetical protein